MKNYILLFACALMLLTSFVIEKYPAQKLDANNSIAITAGEDEENREQYILTRKKLEDEEKYPWFSKNYSAYTPDAATVNRLKELKKHLNFSVWGASWCNDCHVLLPQFFKTMDEAGIRNSRILLYGIDREKKTVVKPNVFHTVQDCGVTKVPTFVVFYDKKEVGRIIEKSETSIEADILKIIEKAEAADKKDKKAKS